MRSVTPRESPDQEPNREYPTGDEGEAERIRAQLPAHTARHERLDRAADLFLKTVGTEGYFVLAGQEFLDAAIGLDREAIIERAAAKLAERLSRAPIEEARRAVWNDARRIFGWQDLATLEPRGRS